MKKIVSDPLDNYYNHALIVQMFTQMNELNMDSIPKFEKEINEYIEHKQKTGNNLEEIKAYGLSMRLQTDSEFKKQMLEATMQHQAIIAASVDPDPMFYETYLCPQIKYLAAFDFEDTREYRIDKLQNFSFDYLEKEGLFFVDSIVDRIKTRVQEMKEYFLNLQNKKEVNNHD